MVRIEQGMLTTRVAEVQAKAFRKERRADAEEWASFVVGCATFGNRAIVRAWIRPDPEWPDTISAVVVTFEDEQSLANFEVEHGDPDF